MENSGHLNRRVLFAQSHDELLSLKQEHDYNISHVLQLFSEAGYSPDAVDALTPETLQDCGMLVLGALTTEDLQSEKREKDAVREFVEAGGSLLVLLSNSEMILELLTEFIELMNQVGLGIREYHNYQHKFLRLFAPHYITANLHKIRVQNVASVCPLSRATPLIFAKTKAANEPVIACAEFGRGRVVVVGDVSVVTDRFIQAEDNATLISNILQWLTFRNPIDIKELHIPDTIEFGQSGTVTLSVQCNTSTRPDIEYILTSDRGAVIPEPVRHNHAIPPEKTLQIHWKVTPQTLGNQELRLIIKIQGHVPLLFDHLPAMQCCVPGYLTLEIRERLGNLATHFQTGDSFTVEGTLHWMIASSEHIPYALELELDDGLIETGHEPDKGLWHVKAVTPGSQAVVLKVAETGQALPAVVTVSASTKDRLDELRAAFICPLEAEIIERLGQVDQRLIASHITDKPFKLVSPEEFIQEVYHGKGNIIAWFRDVLMAAYREQWYNPDLLNTILTHLAPTFLPNRGSFVPYAPDLASKLGMLHPSSRKSLEYNLLCSEESEAINTKQNIAAYLIHEKFGHGFFYANTRLGQQLAILESAQAIDEGYVTAVSVLKDSAIVVNEGFAAWLELTFLGKLDREVRQAVHPRYLHLIKNATGLQRDRLGSLFFKAFPPRYDSRYREGFEYLEVIAEHTHIRCVIRLFLLAMQIEFGITEDRGQIKFEVAAKEMFDRLTNPDEQQWCAHLRLQKIADLFYKQETRVKAFVRKQDCPDDCWQRVCPLEAFIADELQWRRV